MFQTSIPSPPAYSDPAGMPLTNIAGETYGAASRCIHHGQAWTQIVDGQDNTSDFGVGCYEVIKVYV